jgi:hypothetical protein
MVDPNNMTFEEFRGVMSYNFQGIDPLCDITPLNSSNVMLFGSTIFPPY